MLTVPGLPPAAAEAAAKPTLRTYAVQGTDLAVALLPGPAATILLYAARRFHYEIDALRSGDLVTDASGTVLDIRPGWYPAGARDGFLPYQLIVVHDIVAQCDGLLRWGGDERTPREGRFAIAVAPTDHRLRVLAKRLDTDAASPSRRVGAGTALPFTTDRVRRAQSLRRSMIR
ncbi:hypothetical protein ACWT_3286 [Actinoplanes sp. SE50]|nr:hypothetical protein ACPL_3414 [Actinoplanes sp. SE50/110]ATO82701.1 hypothetical protein ACWT_3286 [Actinoplanes sp. SE50]SLM00108.1 hypothetical protein ACSP50_3340 [Actinoplanes sp. SE50/110]